MCCLLLAVEWPRSISSLEGIQSPKPGFSFIRLIFLRILVAIYVFCVVSWLQLYLVSSTSQVIG